MKIYKIHMIKNILKIKKNCGYIMINIVIGAR